VAVLEAQWDTFTDLYSAIYVIFLARIAFGIVSPRVMPMRLGRDLAFGS
jgi:hypothetical protein